MPGATPRYAIPYPLLGETAGSAEVAATMTAISATLAAARSRVDAYLLRPYLSTSPASSTLTLATDSTANWTVLQNTAGTFVSAGRIAVTEAGLYYANLKDFLLFPTTQTVTAFAVWIESVVGAVVTRLYGKSKVYTTGFTNVGGLISCNAGDQLRIRVRWAGVGVPITDFGGQWSLVKVGNL